MTLKLGLANAILIQNRLICLIHGPESEYAIWIVDTDLFFQLFCNLLNDRAVGTPIFSGKENLFRIENVADMKQTKNIILFFLLRIFCC